MRKSKNATVSHTKLFLWYLLFALLVLAFLPVSAGAEEQENTLTLPDEYQDYLDALPDDVADQLPDGILTEDGEALGDAVFEMSSFSYLLQTALSMMGLKLSSAVSTLAEIVGLLLLSALAKAFQKSLKSDGVSRAFSFCASSVMTLCLLSKSYLGLSSVSNYFESLSRMTTASLPLMGALYAMGGNVATAVASTAGLSVYLTVLEGVIAKSILPFCGICMASALVGGLDPSLRIDTAISTVKKKYTTLLSFLMMLLIAMLSVQTTIAARQDGLAMKSVKFAAGNWIPVVGGSVGELLKTVGGGVGYLRGAVGLSGILLLLLTLLPTLIELFLARCVWQLSASLADLLGCEGEKKLLLEFSSLLGYLIAAVSIVSSVFLIALALLVNCASAIG